jgi:hypothetical protein
MQHYQGRNQKMREKIKEFYCRLSLYTFHPRFYLILLILICAGELLARAGGGGGFRGGGGRSFGGGFHSSRGGSSGNGGDILFLIYFIIRYPYISIPLIIVFIVVGYFSKEPASNAYAGSKIRKIKSSNLQKKLEEITGRDSEFNIDIFNNRVKNAFLKLQGAWCRQEIEAVRPFISDGIAERFKLQYAEQKENGVRNVMENIAVDRIVPVHVEADEVFESLTVGINASAVDYMIDVSSGKEVSGTRCDEDFTEYWTFIRRSGVKSFNKNGLMEGNCPNCGYLLEVNESAKCESCGALIKNGQYDWVLCEITQASEWDAVDKSVIPGVKQIRMTDSLFSPQVLEDKTSVAFWRYTRAVQTGKLSVVEKTATDKLCANVKKMLKCNDKGFRLVPAEPAVGSVETIGIDINDDYDRALVLVRWSSKRARLYSDGRKEVVGGSSLTSSYFILIREHGVTEDDTGFSSSHCPGCGAPVSDEAANGCEYCGTVLNDPSADWVVDVVNSRYNEEVDVIFRSIADQENIVNASNPRPLEMAAWMIFVMLSDFVIDDGEMKLLKNFAAQRNIPESRLNELIESAKNGTLEIPVPQGPKEARDWLSAAVKMAFSDGVLSSEEIRLLFAMGEKNGFTKMEVKQIIAKERTRVLKELKKRT